MRRPRTPAELELALRSAGEEVERLVRLAEDLLVLARADEGDLAIRAERMEARELLADVARRQSTRAASAARAIDVSAPADLALWAIDDVSSRRSRTSSTTRCSTARERSGWMRARRTASSC